MTTIQEAPPTETVAPTKPLNLHQKILAVMEDVGYLQRDIKVAFKSVKYNAISETKVTTEVRKALLKYGLTFYPVNQVYEKKGDIATVQMTYRLTDAESGDFIDVVSTGEGADTQDKAAGKASTYAYKYALLRLFAIPTGEDPDNISSDELTEKKLTTTDARSELIGSINQLYMELMALGHNGQYLSQMMNQSINKVFMNLEELATGELYTLKTTLNQLKGTK